MGWVQRNRAITDAVLFFAALMLAWEFGVKAFEVKAYLLPAPSDVLREAWASRAALLTNGWVTLQEVVIGAPVELRLRVLDAVTGEDLRTAEVVWHARRPEQRPTGFEDVSRFDAGLDRYVVRSAAVPIELWVTVDGYSPSFGELDLSTGTTEHTVRLERACAIVLRLKAGDVALTIPSGWSASPTSPSTGGETRMIEFGTSEARFVVSAPGTYELTPPKLSGYKDPGPQRIEVFAGQETQFVVEYERER